MADALIPLYSTTLASATASVSISGIPGTYRDLRLVISASTVNSAAYIRAQVNGDSTATYSYVFAMGNGSTVTSSSYGSDTGLLLSADNRASTGQQSVITVDFMDYAATDKHKSVLSRSSVAGSVNPGVGMTASRWPSTSAITSIALVCNTGNIEAGSTFALYAVQG